jgi:Tol biopolymer transport system component
VKRHPSFSPDGDSVTFSWEGLRQDNPDIYVQHIGGGPPLQLTTDPANDYSPAWSPDGRWIAFVRAQADKNELRLIPPLGGPERKLTETRPQRELLRRSSIAWCPDSTCILVTDSIAGEKGDALYVVSLDSGEKRQLTHPPSLLADIDPAVSPDGRWLVFQRSTSPFVGELELLSLGTGLVGNGEPARLTPQSQYAADPSWMPDSKEILFSAKGSLWRLSAAGSTAPTRLPFVGEDGVTPAVSRPQTGRPVRLMYVRSYQDQNIVRIETSAPGVPASSPPSNAIASTRFEGSPQFSPDGRRVVFTSKDRIF